MTFLSNKFNIPTLSLSNSVEHISDPIRYIVDSRNVLKHPCISKTKLNLKRVLFYSNGNMEYTKKDTICFSLSCVAVDISKQRVVFVGVTKKSESWDIYI